MLTIEDIRNPDRKSGFVHVSNARGGPTPGPGVQNNRSARWRGVAGGGHPERASYWIGPCRPTPEEAAQDYCDYINSGKAPAPRPRAKRAPVPILNLQRAHHAPRPAKTAARTATKRKRKPQPIKQGYVYLVGILRNERAVKVGGSSDPNFARLREMQTGNPELLVGIAEFPGTWGGEGSDERKLHHRYEADNILNEWFEVTHELLSEFDVSPQEFAIATDTVEMEIA